MAMIDTQHLILSPEQLAEWTPTYRRQYAQRLPKSWPAVRDLLARSETAMRSPPDYEPDPDPESETVPPRRIRVAEIVHACAKCSEVGILELKSPRRAANVVHARQLAMYLAKKHTDKSLPEIGRRCGGKDHSTVLHACRRVQEDLDAGGEVFGLLRTEVERELGVA